ncbi:MAG TPA: Ig-like domain-containing protein [Bacilli bacterium]|nr:Ig-like domain-containing protein [Bacilli bacterium]
MILNNKNVDDNENTRQDENFDYDVNNNFSNSEKRNTKLFNKNKIVKLSLFVFGIIVIIVIIIIIAMTCSNRNRLKGFTLSNDINSSNELITYVDESKEFSALVTGTKKDGAFTFTIEDSKIAKIKNKKETGTEVDNKITGLKAGETNLKIIATIEKKEYGEDVTIIVCDRFDISDISNNTIEIMVSQTKSLGLNLGDDARCYATITASFSKTGIVKIDDKLNITGISDGSTVLTISNGVISKDLNIIVSDPNKTILVESIKVDLSSITLKVGDEKSIKLSVLPDDANNKEVSWSSDKASVAIVSQTGIITAKSVGTATIMVRAQDGSDKTSTVMVTVVPK